MNMVKDTTIIIKKSLHKKKILKKDFIIYYPILKIGMKKLILNVGGVLIILQHFH